MATSMKRRNRIGDLIARLLRRQAGDTGRLSGHGPTGMNQQPRVRWSDDGAAIVGSPQNLQEKLIAYEARRWGQQQAADRSARQPEPTSSSPGGIADQDAMTPRLRSPRSTWADKWQR